MMTSDGKFIVASNASVASIIELISDNMEKASSILSKSAEYALEEERLAARCVRELGLIQGSSESLMFDFDSAGLGARVGFG